MSTGWKAIWSTRIRPTRPSAPISDSCRGSIICRQSHQRKWLYYKLFPNVAFDIYPDQVDFMQFLPVSATETVIREISYALPDDRREMKAARHLNWRINRRVNAEDTELITRVQLGMQSAELQGGAAGDERGVPAGASRRSSASSFRRRGWNRRRRRVGAALAQRRFASRPARSASPSRAASAPQVGSKPGALKGPKRKDEPERKIARQNAARSLREPAASGCAAQPIKDKRRNRAKSGS